MTLCPRLLFERSSKVLEGEDFALEHKFRISAFERMLILQHTSYTASGSHAWCIVFSPY